MESVLFPSFSFSIIIIQYSIVDHCHISTKQPTFIVMCIIITIYTIFYHIIIITPTYHKLLHTLQGGHGVGVGPPIHLTTADTSRPSWRGGQEVYPSSPKVPDGRYIVMLLCDTLKLWFHCLVQSCSFLWLFCVWFFFKLHLKQLFVP